MNKFYIHLLILFILSIGKKEILKTLINNKDYEVVKIISKDESIYTQGLFFSLNSKSLFESGGLYKESVLIKYAYPSMMKKKEIKLDPKFFAEGIAVCYSRKDNQFVLFQLTYQERVILKYSYPSMNYIDLIPIDKRLKEGWGLTSSFIPNKLLATNGSDSIFVLNCDEDLEVSSVIKVAFVINNSKKEDEDENGEHLKPLDRLNELTFANGFIYANRYFDHSIYKINPESGRVVRKYDMSQLALHEITHHKMTNERLNKGDVLNGIAYDYTTNTFLLTGKRWSNYYLVKFYE